MAGVSFSATNASDVMYTTSGRTGHSLTREHERLEKKVGLRFTRKSYTQEPLYTEVISVERTLPLASTTHQFENLGFEEQTKSITQLHGA